VYEKNYYYYFIYFLVLILSSCAEKQAIQECVEGHPAGFLEGIFHGLISPASFVLMLFEDNITVYATNNSGKWYALGFIIGTGGFTKLISWIKDFFGGDKKSKTNKK